MIVRGATVLKMFAIYMCEFSKVGNTKISEIHIILVASSYWTG